jgi:hypothetical protein
VFKASRHPMIKDGIGYNRYDGKANGRKMINGVACVKFNKSVPLVDLINKVNNVATPTTPLSTTRTTRRSKWRCPSNKCLFHTITFVIICVVGTRMARLL